MFETTVFIGRFQPVHNGHVAVIRQALQQSYQLIILVGSANRARDIRNPFTYVERVAMLKSCFTNAELARIYFCPLDDYLYQNNAWVENVQRIVHERTARASDSIALIGHNKDSSSFYLKLFPQWESIAATNVNNINSTQIRNYYFENSIEVLKYVPVSVAHKLNDFMLGNDTYDIYGKLQKEYRFVQEYKKQWGVAPYPVIFQTVDAVVEQSGHVLMVERGANPGKGLKALPGGFLNVNETLLDGAVRELYEETKLKVPKPVLLGSLESEKVFDDPHRSTRGRTITTAFHFKLRDMEELPKVKGSDDAKKAFWVPIANLKDEECFEDHSFILRYFLNR